MAAKNNAPSPLISAPSLSDRIQAGAPLLLLDARPRRDAFLAGHLASARFAGLESELSAPPASSADAARGGRHPLPSPQRWTEQLAHWGITAPGTDEVVVYDQRDSSMAAARCWWMLRASGVRHVRVLDGGLDAWTRLGSPLEPGEEEGTRGAAASPTHAPSFDSEQIIDLETVRSRCAEPALSGAVSSQGPESLAVLDARSTQRYRGEGDPFDPATGHIPGSLSAPFTQGVREDGTFRPPEELRAWLAPLVGEADSGSLAVSCGSGVTACHLALSLEIAGLPRPQLYVGSWSEWCRRNLPIAIGAEP